MIALILIGFFLVIAAIVKSYYLLKKLITQNHLTIMADQKERFDALVSRLDAVTNDIATDYKTLLDAIKNNTPISEEQFAKAEANVATLEGLGASVDNPVPPVEPPVEETPGESDEV